MGVLPNRQHPITSDDRTGRRVVVAAVAGEGVLLLLLLLLRVGLAVAAHPARSPPGRLLLPSLVVLGVGVGIGRIDRSGRVLCADVVLREDGLACVHHFSNVRDTSTQNA